MKRIKLSKDSAQKPLDPDIFIGMLFQRAKC